MNSNFFKVCVWLIQICLVVGDLPTTIQQAQILSLHNTLRANENATNMRQMAYDGQLEKTASAWADNCHFAHNSPSTANTAYGYIGQNLYAASRSTVSFTNAINAWFREKSSYDFPTKTCTGICGHYTQLVWASSYGVGCGYKVCPLIPETNWKNATLIVCNYGPGGNIAKANPYNVGTPCSACPAGTTYNANKLCA